jgi:hypothetical protein
LLGVWHLAFGVCGGRAATSLTVSNVHHQLIPPMSAMIKAISNVRLPFSRTTMIIVAVWACAFAAYIAAGLRN